MIDDGKSRCCAQPSSASSASNVKYLTLSLRFVAGLAIYADCVVAAAAPAGCNPNFGLAGLAPRWTSDACSVLLASPDLALAASCLLAR